MSEGTKAVNCDEAELLLAAWSMGDIDASDHRVLRRHLTGCADCRATGAAYLRAADALALAVDDAQPPAELRSRLLAAVHAEAAGSSAGARPWWRRLWERVPAGRGFTAAGASLAAVAVAAAVVVAVVRGGSSSTPVALNACGSGASSGVCASLHLDSGSRAAVLSVTGLASAGSTARPDATYEAWLVRSDGSVEAAAYLTPSPDGLAYDAAMTGDLSPYVAVALTREPAGGSDRPTGPQLLRVDLPRTAAT